MQVSYLCNYSDDGRPNSASIFIGGFVLGGIIVGTLGCVYAPQVVHLHSLPIALLTGNA